ncbi:MAG: sn-glycerol-3-phosphate ABC transporter ATP-binding protein UgpC [Candidatus Cloacimonetes bacterium]|nr:sn-glycerol-3-phosphate ABC transporter ATP-binding protein UgpC [Candidatus Cloacimonadota bacterium]MBL7148687.1 sn-glycerol-3-phosphate ABC transporter ATP-binding protein UgpC [Candidatus Cloacimonadota bacterium]
MAKVILRNVNKIYENNIHVVKDNNLEIKDKEFMVLVGPSGCGKSTTLRMIAGLEEITSGEILIGDKVVNNIQPKDRDIAMVFQNYALYPHMSVYQNLSYGLRLRKFPKSEIERRVNEVAGILGLTELLNRKPRALSGGQRQRVAVGRAIIRNPKVFLFDEPLSNLDAKLRVQMRAELSKLHKRLDTTIIYVTHDQVEAMTMGDRITVLNDGLIQQVDTPLNLYDHPKNLFVAGFIGSPSMNFIDGKIEEENGLHFITTGIKIPVPPQHVNKIKKYLGKKVILGIRPENLYLKKEGDIETTIEVIEPMGNEIILYCAIEEIKFIVRIDVREHFKPGDIARMAVKKDYFHFFDPETELNITYGLEE